MEKYGTKNSKLYNVFAVIVGALLLGFLWRIRGTGGWGSSWGLLNAGFVFTMFLSIVAGARKKLNLVWISISAASFMLTTPAWGTLLNQITGAMDSIDGKYEGMTNTLTYISPWSGVAMMLMLGFGLASIYGIMLGRGFSDKQWKLWHFAVVIGVSLAVYYLAMATFAHPIIKLIQPESIKNFEQGLNTAGKEYDSVYKIYLSHFNNLSWAKKIGGGRNYFSEIQTIASAFRAVAAIVTTLVVVKDKVAAKVGAITCATFSVAITVADIIFYFSDGGYHRAEGLSFPEIIGGGWSCWEFSTGFIAGAVLTILVLNLKKKADVEEPTFNFLPQKAQTVLGFIAAFGFGIGVNLIRPLIERLDESSVGVIIAVVGSVLIVYVAFLVFYLKKNGVRLQRTTMDKFAPIMTAIMVVYDIIVYMFVSDSGEAVIHENVSVLMIMMFVSAISVAMFCLMSYKSNNAQ